MAEVNTADVEAKVDAAFGAGFGDTPPAPAEKVVEETKPEAVTPEPVVVAPVVVPEKPQYVRLTKQEWDNTKAAAGKVSSLESQLAKLTGSMPKAEQIVQQALESLRSQTPAGLDVEMSEEDFAELTAEFPEIGKGMKTALERILKKANVKGTGPAQAPVPSPAQPVDMDAALEKALLAREAKALEKAYPDWSEIVGRPPTDGAEPPSTEFRAWLGKQSPEYQKAVLETDSPADVREAIASFKASQSEPASPSPVPDKASARRAVIADAVTPRADGNPPPLNPPQTAEEAFSKAFKAVKAH